MTRFPEQDVADFPPELGLRLQNIQTFQELHTIGEANNYFFAVGHKAIELAATPSLDNPLLTSAMVTGVQAYEIISAFTVPGQTYMGPDEQQVVFAGARRFVDDIHCDEDFMKRADYARERLLEDAPNLADLLAEVTGRHHAHDNVAVTFALKGAGILRSMHIHVVRQLQHDAA